MSAHSGGRGKEDRVRTGQEILSHSYRSACPRTAENLDFQWDKEAVKIGTTLGMESVNKEQLWVCQGNQVQGDFMGGMRLVNNTHRKRIRDSVTYVKIAVQYLNRDTLGTQSGLLVWFLQVLSTANRNKT